MQEQEQVIVVLAAFLYDILWLVFLFELKHFIFDGLLQTRYHFGKYNEKFKDYWKPLLNHSFINATGAGLVACIFGCSFVLWLSIILIETILHFGIDRIKTSKKLLGRWTYTEPMYWHALMFDQMLHRICYILYIITIMGLFI